MPPLWVGTSSVLTDTQNGGSKVLPDECGEQSGRLYCLPEISLGHFPVLKPGAG